MLPDYEIVLGQGIGTILFGITKEELIEILGEPDEIDMPDNSKGYHWESYQYNAIKCSFSFDQDREGRLVEISVENGYFRIAKHIRVGLKKEDLLNSSLAQKFGKYIIEDMRSEELPTHEVISIAQVGLNLWLDDGKISTIQILKNKLVQNNVNDQPH